MKRLLTLLVLSFLFNGIIISQNALPLWYCGSAQMSWCNLQANGDPTVSYSANSLGEGYAMLTTATCDLICLTDGITVWGSNYAPMPNSMNSSPGGSLLGDPSSTQSALLVKNPANGFSYYIFTVDANLGTNGLNYSLIDFSLNSGYGDVVPGIKNINLLSTCTEKLTAIKHSNGIDYWVLAHDWGNANYVAYHVSASGVNPIPVTSTIGIVLNGGTAVSRGCLKVSQTGDMVAAAIEGEDMYEVFDFDRSTGVLSNYVALTGTNYNDCYGVEFSANGQYLYGSERWGNELRQWDVSLGTATAVQASEVVVGTLSTNNGGYLQIANDNKIYLARNNQQFVGRINNPEQAGALCNYIDQGLSLGASTSGSGFPNMPVDNPTSLGPLLASVAITDTILCAGDSTGGIEVTITGGTPPYSIEWSNGNTTASVQNLPAGTYTVTVTDSNSNNFIGSVALTQAAALMASYEILPIDTVLSTLGSIDITVSGGSGGYSYLWSTGDTIADLSNLQNNSYNCTVSDSLGCEYKLYTTVGYYSEPQALITSANIDHNICPLVCIGSIDVSISGGYAPYTYQWSNGAVSEDLDSLCSGTYGLSVYDANQVLQSSTLPWTYITSSETHVINIPPNTISIDGVPIVNGDYIGLFYSKDGNYQCGGYAEYTGATINLTVYGDDIGTTIKDGFEQAEYFNWRIWRASSGVQTIALPNYLDTWPDTDHFNTNGSSRIVNANALSMYQLYTQTIVNLTINGPEAIDPNPLFSNYNNYNISTIGNSDGWIDLSTSGGTAPYIFAWSNGAITEDLSALNANFYNLTITDANACSAEFSYLLSEPFTPLSTTAIINNESCVNACDGSIDLSISGGYVPYYFSWSNGATTEDIENLCPGVYDVTIGDNATQPSPVMPWTYSNTGINHTVLISTTAIDSAAIQTGDYIGAFYLTNGVYTCGGYSEVINSSIITPVTVWGNDSSTGLKDGFENGETFLWKTWRNASGAISQLNAIYDATMPAVGEYTTNGMSVVDSFNILDNHIYLSLTVEAADSIIINETITHVDPVNGSDGAIIVAVSGGTPPYAYSWSTGSTLSSINNLVPGTYFLTVTDIMGCSAVKSFVLDYSAPSLYFTLLSSASSCYNSATGSAWVENTVGVAPFTFQWSDGSTGDSIFNITAGMYSVTANGANGDSYTDSIEVLDAVQITANFISTGADITSGTGGSINVTISGGTAPYTYLWSTGSVNQNLINCDYGNYSLTVSDMVNCSVEFNTFVDYTTLPAWDMSFSGDSHSIHLPANANLQVNGAAIAENDFIGVFYDVNGVLKCGGYCIWQATGSTILAYADNSATTTIDGFLAGDEFSWKFWDASTNLEHPAVATYQSSYPNQQFFAIGGSSAIDSVQTNSLSGTVSLGTKSNLAMGIMLLYQQTASGYSAVNKCPIIDGSFGIEGLHSGDYLLYAIPKPNQDDAIPGYYVNKQNWENANWVHVVAHTTAVNVEINQAINTAGPGSISGTVLLGTDENYDPNIFNEDWFPAAKPDDTPARNIVVLLYDDQMNAMNFKLSDENGSFNFDQLSYGTYYVQVEKAGLQSEALQVVLSTETPSVNWLSFTLNQGQVLAVENSIAESTINIYPNPVKENLHISITGNTNDLLIELFTITGQSIKHQQLQGALDHEDYIIDVSSMKPGVYLLKASTNNEVLIKKITKI